LSEREVRAKLKREEEEERVEHLHMRTGQSLSGSVGYGGYTITSALTLSRRNSLKASPEVSDPPMEKPEPSKSFGRRNFPL